MGSVKYRQSELQKYMRRSEGGLGLKGGPRMVPLKITVVKGQMEDQLVMWIVKDTMSKGRWLERRVRRAPTS